MELESKDLYFDYRAGDVIQVDQIEDVGSGMFPSYYAVDGKQLLASTSAVSIIEHFGELQQNSNFVPEEMFKRSPFWVGNETVDKRIFRLRPFEQRSCDSSEIRFHPQRKAISKKEFLEKSVYHLKAWVHEIETKFSDQSFVLFTGGRDSRVSYLIPKLSASRWHIFSSEPNGSLVLEWLEANGFQKNRFFSHSGVNDDTLDDLKAKILASDLMCHPSDIRWTGTVKRIADVFMQGKCVFALGNAGDTLYACRDTPLLQNHSARYFELAPQQNQGVQGTYHQTIFNLTGYPIFSIYAAPRAWQDLYQIFEPSAFENTDLRPELGNLFAGRDLKWFGDDSKIRPEAWDPGRTDIMDLYLAGIHERLSA